MRPAAPGIGGDGIANRILSNPPQLFEPIDPEGLQGSFRLTVSLRLDGWIEEAFLTAALRRLQRRHPFKDSAKGGSHGVKRRAGCCTSASRRADRWRPLSSFAISDGMSAIMLMDDLLTEYAKAEAREAAPPGPPLPAVTARRAAFQRDHSGCTGWVVSRAS